MHKSGAFALSFGITFAHIFSQLFLGQLLVFYKVLYSKRIYSAHFLPCMKNDQKRTKMHLNEVGLTSTEFFKI